MPALTDLLKPISEIIGPEKLLLVDVGAAEGIQKRWLPFRSVIKTIGFEPNRMEFAKLTDRENEHWINAAVAGKPGPRTVHLTRRYNNSSMLEPNYELINQLEWDDFDITSTIEIECVTLDEAVGALHPSFLKLDTQGSEHEILLASQQILSDDIVMVEVEVAFCELYKNEPQFGDVDQLLRSYSFYLHDLGNLLFVKPRGMGGIGGPKGRLIQADGLYFKQPRLLREASDQRIAAALVSYLAYGYPELGLRLLDILRDTDRKFPFAEKIHSALRRLKHSSAFFPYIPAQNFIARCFKRVWLGIRPVSHSLWETELGNRLR